MSHGTVKSLPQFKHQTFLYHYRWRFLCHATKYFQTLFANPNFFSFPSPTFLEELWPCNNNHYRFPWKDMQVILFGDLYGGRLSSWDMFIGLPVVYIAAGSCIRFFPHLGQSGSSSDLPMSDRYLWSLHSPPTPPLSSVPMLLSASFGTWNGPMMKRPETDSSLFDDHLWKLAEMLL